MFFIFFTIKVIYFGIQELNENAEQRKHINFSYLKELENPASNENKLIAKEISSFLKDIKEFGINSNIDDVYFGFMVDRKKLQLENGACIWNPSNTKIPAFSINPEIINNPVALKTTIYHELGHCVLGLDHNNLILGKHKGVEIPLSIMHEAAINDQYVYDNFNLYKKRLFEDGLNNTSYYNPNYLDFFINKTLIMFISPFLKIFKFEVTSPVSLGLSLLRAICHTLALLFLVSLVRQSFKNIGRKALELVFYK